jgi:drug/metabolite transporter superfamily protein YnfA
LGKFIVNKLAILKLGAWLRQTGDLSWMEFGRLYSSFLGIYITGDVVFGGVYRAV